MANHDEALGYASAAGPARTSTVLHTSADGLDAGIVYIPAGDRAIRGYVACQTGVLGAPLLLVLSEAFGLHEHIADVARRFARLGYFAIAPDLMARQGDPAAFTDIATLVSDLLLRIPDGQVMADLDATVTWARSHGASSDQLSATGFCWGGRWTWLYAAHRRLDAAVAWYGILDGSEVFPQDRSSFPRHPFDLAGELRSPVLGLYGGQDEAIPIGSIKEMEARLASGNMAARASSIHVYPAAPHAFFADYRDSYRERDAGDAWQRCLDWLKGHAPDR